MEEIQNVIAEIESKVQKIRAALEDAKTENFSLKEEMELLMEKMQRREGELLNFQNKYNALHQEFQQEKEKSSKNEMDKNAEIDALVREIDDCINRLRVE